MQYIRVGRWFAAALVAAFTQFVAADVRAGDSLLTPTADSGSSEADGTSITSPSISRLEVAKNW